jgi:DNA modification methylase
LKWATIEVVVVEGLKTSEERVVMHNLQRVKTQEEIINESQYYLSLFPPEQGKRNDLDPKEVDANSTPKDKKKVTRFDKAAELLEHSISASTVRRIDNVIQATKQAKADGLTELLDMKIEEKMRGGEYTPATADNLIKNYHKFAKERTEEKGKEVVSKEVDTRFKLYNESSESMKKVKSETVQTVVSSPPYFQARNYGNSTPDKVEIGHEETPEEFVESLMPHFREVHRVLKVTGSYFMNFGEYGNNGYSPLVSNMLILRLHQEGLFKCVNEIILHKKNMKPVNSNRHLMKSYEKIFHLVKDHKKYTYYPLKIWRDTPMKVVHAFNNRGTKGTIQSREAIQRPYRNFRDFIELQEYEDIISSTGAYTAMFKKIDPNFDHAAPYDSKLCLLAILTTSQPADLILDPFSGTGSTGEAALMLGRNYVGYEINKLYHEFALKRIPIMTKEFNEADVEILEGLTTK